MLVSADNNMQVVGPAVDFVELPTTPVAVVPDDLLDQRSLLCIQYASPFDHARLGFELPQGIG
jgi:hypothetical protein